MMEFKPNAIEAGRVSALEPFDRYKYTMKKVADFELIYTLVHENETWASVEVDGRTIVSLWPAIVYAQANATDLWAHHRVLAIPLDELLSTHLESFEESGFLINVFSKPNKTGHVISSDEFRVDLEKELENY